ncbi:HAD family phosphatase [Endozoicomonas sp. SCSIO W0465]|uniref:histidinol-phosphatase n=1 Tax=Endozoicomonas sp. SCSIO W0465 TaxID=2918516 RepID=UPI002076401B|nr:HAD family hydrolase [Endozoicomonas sp. SCSIO W0465]USE36484.1 HAD-IB family hydrolase [Endozoicomonas sp. SCSIO W0465]
MALAIFDLDNTLIAGDSDALWGEFMVANGLVDTESFRADNNRFYEQYKQGVMDIWEYLDFCLKPLTQYPLEALESWHGQFMEQVIIPILLDKGLTRIAKHRQQGDHIMMITATNRFVTERIAEQFKVDTLLAIDLEVSDSHYTGKVTGTPTYQQGKVLRLQEWLNQHPEHSMAGSYFYSDSQNDLPLLKKVDNPVAVDPDPELKRFAEKQGWKIISFR